MHCWPLSLLYTSALMPGDCALELKQAPNTKKISQRTLNATAWLMERTKPVQMRGLVVIESGDDFLRFGYLERPPLNEWRRLERTCFIETKNSYLLVCGALH